MAPATRHDWATFDPIVFRHPTTSSVLPIRSVGEIFDSRDTKVSGSRVCEMACTPQAARCLSRRLRSCRPARCSGNQGPRVHVERILTLGFGYAHIFRRRIPENAQFLREISNFPGAFATYTFSSPVMGSAAQQSCQTTSGCRNVSRTMAHPAPEYLERFHSQMNTQRGTNKILAQVGDQNRPRLSCDQPRLGEHPFSGVSSPVIQLNQPDRKQAPPLNSISI